MGPGFCYRFGPINCFDFKPCGGPIFTCFEFDDITQRAAQNPHVQRQWKTIRPDVAQQTVWMVNLRTTSAELEDLSCIGRFGRPKCKVSFIERTNQTEVECEDISHTALCGTVAHLQKHIAQNPDTNLVICSTGLYHSWGKEVSPCTHAFPQTT